MPEIDVGTPKSIVDCVREDIDQMKQIQEGLDLLIGHNLLNTEAKIYYRGCSFVIILKETK